MYKVLFNGECDKLTMTSHHCVIVEKFAVIGTDYSFCRKG